MDFIFKYTIYIKYATLSTLRIRNIYFENAKTQTDFTGSDSECIYNKGLLLYIGDQWLNLIGLTWEFKLRHYRQWTNQLTVAHAQWIISGKVKTKRGCQQSNIATELEF